MTLEELQIGFIQSVKERLDVYHKDESRLIPQALKEACINMIEYQTKELALPVGHICITFLNTFYYLGKPVIRIYFYAPGQTWQTPLMHQDFGAEWMVKVLKDYEEQLINLAVENNKTRDWAEVEKRRLLRLLLKLAAYYVKYDLMDYMEWSILESMYKDEDVLVSFGEYMDWQLPIHMCRKEIDIFQVSDKESLHFREFSSIVYRKKQFKNKDLSGARFNECRFIECVFEDTVLNDVIFNSCIFEKCIIRGGEMLGTRFKECKLNGLDMENVKTQQEDNDKITGLFREMEWIDCEVSEDGAI